MIFAAARPEEEEHPWRAAAVERLFPSGGDDTETFALAVAQIQQTIPEEILETLPWREVNGSVPYVDSRVQESIVGNTLAPFEARDVIDTPLHELQMRAVGL